MSEKVRPARPGTGLTEDGRRVQVVTSYARRGSSLTRRSRGRGTLITTSG